MTSFLDLRPSLRALVSALAVLISLVVSLPVVAQGDPLDIEQMIRKRTTPDPDKNKAIEPSSLSPPEETRVQLDVAWSLRREADNNEGRDRLLNEFANIGERMGLPNHPYKAHALLQEAAALVESGDATTAQVRIDQARRLAPVLPSVEFAQVAHSLETNPLDVFSLGRQFGAAYTKGWNHLPTRFRWMTNGLAGLWLALCLFGLGLVLVVQLRHMGLLARDIQRVLPKGVAVIQIILLLLLVVLAPALLTGSLMVSAVVAVVLVGVYMSWPERLAAAVVLGALALLPQIITTSTAGLEFPDSDIAMNTRWTIEGCQEDCQKTLEDKASPETDRQVLQVREMLVINSALRRGPKIGYEGVRERLETMAKGKGLAPEMRFAVLNNLGVALALEGNLDESQKMLDASLRYAKGHWGPSLNLFRVLEFKGESDTADKMLQQAIRLGGETAAKRSQRRDLNPSVWFYIAEVPSEPLYRAHLAMSEGHSERGVAVWKRIGGDLPLDSMPLLAGGALTVLFVVSLIGRLAGASKHCPRCAGPMNKVEDALSHQEGEVCRGCYYCFDGGGQLVYNDRVQHETIAHRHEAFQKWSWRIGNIGYPGIGAALCGVALGIVPMFLAALGGGFLLAGTGLLSDPWRMEHLWVDGHQIASIILVVIAVIISLVLLWLGVPEFKAKPLTSSSTQPFDEGYDEPMRDDEL